MISKPVSANIKYVYMHIFLLHICFNLNFINWSWIYIQVPKCEYKIQLSLEWALCVNSIQTKKEILLNPQKFLMLRFFNYHGLLKQPLTSNFLYEFCIFLRVFWLDNSVFLTFTLLQDSGQIISSCEYCCNSTDPFCHWLAMALLWGLLWIMLILTFYIIYYENLHVHIFTCKEESNRRTWFAYFQF